MSAVEFSAEHTRDGIHVKATLYTGRGHESASTNVTPDEALNLVYDLLGAVNEISGSRLCVGVGRKPHTLTEKQIGYRATDRRDPDVREADIAAVRQWIAERIPTWETQFDAGPGEVCGLSDVATVVDHLLNGPNRA